jgi:hypothetical protein
MYNTCLDNLAYLLLNKFDSILITYLLMTTYAYT